MSASRQGPLFFFPIIYRIRNMGKDYYREEHVNKIIGGFIMKAKKIIERVFKVMNILVNMVIGFIAIVSVINYGTSGYLYSDTIQRIPWIIGMFVVANGADYFIRKIIREF